MNECTSLTHNCSTSATCTNTAGGFTCACIAGYVGDGFNCTFNPSVTIQIKGATTNTGNCFPFGGGGTGVSWLPKVAFMYKNVPAFTLRPGLSRLYFDLYAANTVAPCFDIYFNTGLTIDTVNRVLVANQQTASGVGNTVVGDFDISFPITGAYTFPGGSLTISFVNPCGAFALDTSCTGTLVASSGSDTSGYFDHREYGASGSGTSDIGIFKIIT